MVGIFGIGAYPFCFNIRMVSYAIFWAVLVLVPVGVNMVLKPFGTDKKTIIGPAIGILALVMFLSGVAVENTVIICARTMERSMRQIIRTMKWSNRILR